MAVNNPYAQYQTNRIMTASPAELTLMLYEGCIKFCNIAMAGIEQHDNEKGHNNLLRAQDIIDEFRATLNFKYPVAKDFDNVYVYIRRLLVEANMKKQPEPLEEAMTHLRTMRDTWKEVMKKSGKGAASAGSENE